MMKIIIREDCWNEGRRDGYSLVHGSKRVNVQAARVICSIRMLKLLARWGFGIVRATQTSVF